jgi:ABC-type transport system involved in multi-copper enzyme maturation permease subunit
MKALVEKEIRLLLPAFAGVLALAILPVWLLPDYAFTRGNDGAKLAAYSYLFGILMLALSSFGREIGLKTLPFMLAQPVERTRIWWTKIAVLAVLVGLAFDACWLSGSLCSMIRPARHAPPDALANCGLTVAVFTAGGLWMTLLLRQVAAAFWLTFLIPAAAVIAIGAAGGADWMIFALLVMYAVDGFLLARQQFLNFQDTTWSGGVLSLSRAPATSERSALREHRPWRALFRKELQLHQVTLLGIGCLLLLHIGAVALRKAGADVFGRMTLFALEMFGALWLFVPLLAGSQSVADERQLGTLDGLLCLSVSRKAQFSVKLLFVIVVGGLLSAALLCAVEGAGIAVVGGAILGCVKGIPFNGPARLPIFLVFLVLSLLGFYASTLTRGVMQALAAGVVATLVFWLIASLATHLPQALDAFGWRLWPVMAYPALTAAVLWLAYGNFKWVFESGRRWRWNIFALIAVLVLICGSAAAIYHRAWEWAMPLEGAHGAARLPAGKPVLLRSSGGGLAAVLPDGRLWEDRVVYDTGWLSVGGHHFVTGSNWVDAVADFHETVAIRSDGTLWVSEKPRRPWNRRDGPPTPEESPPLVQFGDETGWLKVEHDTGSLVVLLKQDGTLWGWPGVNTLSRGMRSIPPFRLGQDADWARILRGSQQIYAWKQNGSAWALHETNSFDDPALRRVQVEIAPGMVAEPMPALDNVQFKCLNSRWIGNFDEIGVRYDGTLWYLDGSKDRAARRQKAMSPAGGTILPGLVQIGKDSNWVAVIGGMQLLALKTDGSIWKWSLYRASRDGEGREQAEPPAANFLVKTPLRLGKHRDWVAPGYWGYENVALAADGALWYWPATDWPARYYNGAEPDRWLASSRRPAIIENIFGAPE